MIDRGSAVVEFALVVPLVLLLLLGVVEVALVARGQLMVISAAREGARQAAASLGPSAAVRAARAALGRAPRGAHASHAAARPAGKIVAALPSSMRWMQEGRGAKPPSAKTE